MIIYGLKDPRSGLIRYVGKTTKRVEQRVAEHFAEARHEEHHRAHWFRNLAKLNLVPRAVVLEVVDESSANARERYWIKQFSGPHLTNGTEGGDGGRLSSEAAEKQRTAVRAYLASRPMHHMLGKKHSESTKQRMSDAAKRRISRGDSPIAERKHQSKASLRRWSKPGSKERARAMFTVEERSALGKMGAKARWGNVSAS
jgi:hypothetical protein